MQQPIEQQVQRQGGHFTLPARDLREVTVTLPSPVTNAGEACLYSACDCDRCAADGAAATDSAATTADRCGPASTHSLYSGGLEDTPLAVDLGPLGTVVFGTPYGAALAWGADPDAVCAMAVRAIDEVRGDPDLVRSSHADLIRGALYGSLAAACALYGSLAAACAHADIHAHFSVADWAWRSYGICPQASSADARGYTSPASELVEVYSVSFELDSPTAAAWRNALLEWRPHENSLRVWYQRLPPRALQQH